MLQELGAATGAQIWAIGSMLFFMAVFAVVILLVVGKRRDELERCAQLPLDDDLPPAPGDDADGALQNKDDRHGQV